MYGSLAESRNVNKSGVGLGLTISSTLAALLNGQNHDRGIQVTSCHGEGSRFFFKILKNLNTSLSIDENTRKNVENSLNSSSGRQKQSQDSRVSQNNSSEKEMDESNIACEFMDDRAVYSKMTNYRWKSKDLKENTNSKEESQQTELFPFSNEGLITTCETKNDREQPSRHALPKECVLVVDDNPFNILVAKSLLKDLGHEVKSASGGHEAIEMVQLCTKENVHIKRIFLDCQMPVMDGYETARILKKMMENGEVENTQIMAWTANTSEKDIKRCYENGMSGCIMKPTTKENIMKVLGK